MIVHNLVGAAKNGVAFAYDQCSGALLLSCPQGVYSGARTINGKSIFAFDTILRRLVQPTGLLLKDDSDEALIKALKPRVVATLRAAMGVLSDSKAHDGDEYMLIIIVHPSADAKTVSDVVTAKGDILCHISRLPSTANTDYNSFAKVAVGGAPRTNPLVKHLEWTKARHALFPGASIGVYDEMVLMEPVTRTLFEGTKTNFFVVLQDANGRSIVQTAGTGVIEGTVRRLVLHVCETILDIPVQLQSPPLSEASTWTGAFLTSTPHLVQPIQTIDFVDPDTKAASMRQIRLPQCQVISRIMYAVSQAVQDHGTVVFD